MNYDKLKENTVEELTKLNGLWKFIAYKAGVHEKRVVTLMNGRCKTPPEEELRKILHICRLLNKDYY